MLGKLAKLLRMCGFDTEYVRHGLNTQNVTDFAGEDTIILSRNRKLEKIKDKIKIFNPDHDLPPYQLRMVIRAFNLEDKIKFLSRCMECNVEIVPIPKEEAKGNVPFFVYDNHEEFFKCPSCGRIYWEGSHVRRMAEILKSILGENTKFEE